MESSVLGVMVDTSSLIDAERRYQSATEAIASIQAAVGDLPAAVSAITVAEFAHGIYRAKTIESRMRRRGFLDELKATFPVQPFTGVTAEIAARIGGEQAAKGINLPWGDLLIAASALELGYAVATANVRDFHRIPGLRVIPL